MPAAKDLIHETSTSTGTGNLTTSAVNGKVQFGDATNGFGTGATTDVFDYYISNRDAAEWERGTGHCSALGTLVRDTVTVNSAGTQPSKLSFTAGTKDIANDVPASKQWPVFRTIKVTPFTATGTFTSDANQVFAILVTRGGGGGGGGATSSSATRIGCGGGGGSGALSIAVCSAATMGASQSVTIGTGGGGGAAGNNSGSNGGDTSIGTLCIAKAGQLGAGGASFSLAAGGPGGSAASGTGDMKFDGDPGSLAAGCDTTSGIQNPARGGGNGGGLAVTGFAAVSGNAAAANSGGGGGGGQGANSTGGAGGNGGTGVAFVIEFLK